MRSPPETSPFRVAEMTGRGGGRRPDVAPVPGGGATKLSDAPVAGNGVIGACAFAWDGS